MEVHTTYMNFLLQLLCPNDQPLPDLKVHKQTLIVNLYLTLLSLNNNNYSDDNYEKDNDLIKDFLRRLNNLKIKIQLKRKVTEVDKLSSDLIDEYKQNIAIMSRYFKESDLIEETIISKDTKKLTEMIDKITKEKMEYDETREDLKKIISQIVSFNNTFYIENNIIHFKDNTSKEEVTIPFDMFVLTFNYLLNMDNYKDIYTKATSNKCHTIIIADIIKLLTSDDFTIDKITSIIIPIILNYLLTLDTIDYQSLNTESFNIENIKITDLYSLATEDMKKEALTEQTSKWRNISIPNSYLISKLKELVKKGQYYYKEDMFIFEEQNNFKISIKIENMIAFLIENLSSLKKTKKAK